MNILLLESILREILLDTRKFQEAPIATADDTHKIVSFDYDQKALKEEDSSIIVDSQEE